MPSTVEKLLSDYTRTAAAKAKLRRIADSLEPYPIIEPNAASLPLAIVALSACAELQRTPGLSGLPDQFISKPEQTSRTDGKCGVSDPYIGHLSAQSQIRPAPWT